LLRASAAYAHDFLPPERGNLLLRLSEIARYVNRTEAGDFARQSFQTAALEMAPSWNRVAMEKNAATSMSQVDPAIRERMRGRIGTPVSERAGAPASPKKISIPPKCATAKSF